MSVRHEGPAAAERAPIAIAERAHLDPRFKLFPNLPEDEYESILAVPILAREKLEEADALQACARLTVLDQALHQRTKDTNGHRPNH